jgi:hypothetical protein
MVVQGREITSEDIGLVRQLIEPYPFWNRTRLSKGYVCFGIGVLQTARSRIWPAAPFFVN